MLVSDAISTRKTENEILAREIENRIEIIDRMAIVRMNGLGMRSNGTQSLRLQVMIVMRA